ncbi:MAG: DNA-3-methyladenine glycosylase 2 family protein [Cellvibrionaceae bacterium]
MLSDTVCQQARLSRDPRFDGRFFIAVKTTRIYCRTICPAVAPKESNVVYYASAIEAANAGYRPCLRCRPDSAPNSPAWKGSSTTLERALRLIDDGELQSGSLSSLANRLGVSDRYLRSLFKQHLGVSPKSYALYQQCLFAKQLLHQTTLPITQVALASGFNSVRRFNDCFRSALQLTPTELRRAGKANKSGHSKGNSNGNNKARSSLKLKLYFRPPYDWTYVSQFLQRRAIDGLEWCGKNHYGRMIRWGDCEGQFTATYMGDKNRFDVEIELNELRSVKQLVNNIRRILDLDADIDAVDRHLQAQVGDSLRLSKGLRLPGIWDVFEAGVRAILGQQISVVAAHKLVSLLVERLGNEVDGYYFFPKPEQIMNSSLDFFKMPGARKQTLNDFAAYFLSTSFHSNNDANPDEWIKIKGIGPWTINYAKFRGLSDPDIYLSGDVAVKKAMQLLLDDSRLRESFDPACVSPWRSYLTLHLWKQLL